MKCLLVSQHEIVCNISTIHIKKKQVWKDMHSATTMACSPLFDVCQRRESLEITASLTSGILLLAN
jgi:hypothetical protein